MKKIKRFYQEHRIFTILMAVVLVCMVLIITVLIQCFYVGNGSDKYGNRLEGIEKYKISESRQKDFENNILKSLIVSAWIHPDNMSQKAKTMIEIINNALSDGKNLQDIYEKILFYGIFLKTVLTKQKTYCIICINTVDTERSELMLHLDYGDHRPLYEQIKEKLKELIIGGILQEHDKIPSVRELAANLAINPNTIQKAYKDLENEGYIYSQKAKGSFVSPRENATEHYVCNRV